jgi:K(+)-stimulated pyrophosphate-energized sodium pump
MNERSVLSGPAPGSSSLASRFLAFFAAFVALLALPSVAHADESSLIMPDLSKQQFLGGIDGRTLLMGGLVICLFGFAFGLVMYSQLKNLPVHKSMREISELIYETCKTYLLTQIKFILILEVFIGTIILVYFGVFRQLDALKLVTIMFWSLVGIAGSCGVAWFGIRINTFANSRTAFAASAASPSRPTPSRCRRA